jgi:hypothetical protein
LAVDGVDSDREGQHPVKSAQLDRSVDRSCGRYERELKCVALGTAVKRHQQMQACGVDERQAPQIEHDAPGTLDAVKRGAQRLSGGKVELAAGLHDRDIIAPLYFDREWLETGRLARGAVG